MHRHLLRPFGVAAVPAGIEEAIELYSTRRDELELDLGVSLPRAMEEEVRSGIARITSPH
jgi:hypothetical protein